MRKTKSLTKFFVTLGVFIFLLFIVWGSSHLITQSIVQQSGDFAKPLFGRLACEQSDVYSNPDLVNIPEEGGSVYCGKTEFTDKCEVKVSVEKIGLFDDRVYYTLCNKDDTNCGSKQQTDIRKAVFSSGSGFIDLPELLSGKMYKISCKEDTALYINKECAVEKKWKSFELVDIYGGAAKRIVNSKNCNIPTTEEDTGENVADNILQGSLSARTKTSCIGKIDMGDWCNYVSDWYYGPLTNVFTHPKYGEVYCVGDGIYDIVDVTVQSGKRIKINPNSGDLKTTDGKIIKSVGGRLGTVECCPNMYNCGDNFEWQTTTQRCTTNIDCPNAGNFICSTGKEITLYDCVNEKCVATTKDVECCKSADCSVGWQCQLGSGLANQFKCIQQGPGFFCGDGVCNPGESVLSCSADCNQTPKTNWNSLLTYLPWILGAILFILVLYLMFGRKGNDTYASNYKPSWDKKNSILYKKRR